MSETTLTKLKHHEAIIKRGIQVAGEARQPLDEVCQSLRIVHEEKLYLATHRNFEQYCQECFGFNRQRAYRLLEAKESTEVLSVLTDEISVSQQVQVTVFSSETNEYYTPAEYLQAAREVMGSIDLDPASCEAAQKTVKAGSFFTKLDDGLRQDWSGTVWLNPPYGTTGNESNQGIWGQKLAREYREGHVTEAILLVKAAMGYNWFEELWDHWPVCFARERLSFIRVNGDSNGRSKQGTAFFYFGPNVEKFKQVFHQFGKVWTW